MSVLTLDDGREVVFGFAEKADAKVILSYLKKVGSESDYLSFGFEGVGVDEKKEEEVVTRYARALTSAMIVGKVSGEIVCLGTITSDDKSRFSHNAEIGISVSKEFWRKGIGKTLTSLLLEFAKNSGYVRNVLLTVIAENVGAISLYESQGFVQVGRYKEFSRVGDKFYDAITMQKQI